MLFWCGSLLPYFACCCELLLFRCSIVLRLVWSDMASWFLGSGCCYIVMMLFVCVYMLVECFIVECVRVELLVVSVLFIVS